MYLDAPLVIALARIYPKQGRWNPTAGLLMMCAALALSSFSQNTTHLILTQGALYGIGGSIAYNPCLMYVDEWFDRRKGLAYGLMVSHIRLIVCLGFLPWGRRLLDRAFVSVAHLFQY